MAMDRTSSTPAATVLPVPGAPANSAEMPEPVAFSASSSGREGREMRFLATGQSSLEM